MKILILFFFISSLVSAQTDSSSFNFWIGDWVGEWKDVNGKSYTAINKVKLILDNAVLEENFRSNVEGKGLNGNSYSVYDKNEKMWRQTWVDNYGGYLLFEGGMVNDEMILIREGKDKKGNPIKQRMIFYNITENNFDWNWEKLNDQNNWELVWKIHYTRIK